MRTPCKEKTFLNYLPWKKMLVLHTKALAAMAVSALWNVGGQAFICGCQKFKEDNVLDHLKSTTAAVGGHQGFLAPLLF